MIKLDLLSDNSVTAHTKPDQGGKTKRLIIELSKFKDNPEVEGIQFRYNFGQGKGIYYTAAYGECQHILQMLRNVLRSKEPITETLPHQTKNRADILLEVGRNSQLEPFIRLRGSSSDGQPLNKEFYFKLSGGKKTILRNGAPIPDLELQERCALIFINSFDLYLRALEENYVKRQWEPRGGGYGGQQQYGQQKPQYGQQQPQYNAAPNVTSNMDDILD